MKRLLSLFAFLVLGVSAFAATFSANTVWEVETGGDDTNGGGYVTGSSGTDFSQQAAAQYTFTTATSAGAGAVFLDAQAAAVMVGNILHITGGTNFTTGWYHVQSVSVGVSMTLDRNCTTGVGANGAGKLGGCFLTLAGAHAAMVSPAAAGVGGNICYIKSGTYTLGATTTFTLSTNIAINFVGYNTTRTLVNTDATRPLVTTATNSVPLFTFNNANAIYFRNLTFTTTAGTKSLAITNVTTGSGTVAPMAFINCKWSTAFPGILSFGSSSSLTSCTFRSCEFTGIAGTAVFEFALNGTNQVMALDCNFHANSSPCVTLSGGSTNQFVAQNCLFVDNTARAIYFNVTTSGSWLQFELKNCTIANNTTANMEILTTAAVNGTIVLENNIFYGSNPTLKLATAGTDKSILAVNNAFGGGGSTTNYTTGQGDITLSGDPFTSAAGGDYSLNNTAGAGASCRGAGWPQTFPAGTTTSRPDVGAAQHTESAAATQTSYSY